MLETVYGGDKADSDVDDLKMWRFVDDGDWISMLVEPFNDGARR